MPDQSVRDIRNALKPTPAGRLRRRAWLRTLAVTLAVLLVLTGVEVGVRMLPPDAVQVRASDAVTGQTLATATVNDKGTVADLYARINSLPAVSLTSNCSPELRYPGAVTFELDFMRWGLPIEAATLLGYGCGWEVSQGAIPSLHDDPNGHTQAILSELHTLLPGVRSP